MKNLPQYSTPRTKRASASWLSGPAPQERSPSIAKRSEFDDGTARTVPRASTSPPTPHRRYQLFSATVSPLGRFLRMEQEVGKLGRFDDCSGEVIGACTEAHPHLGAGL